MDSPQTIRILNVGISKKVPLILGKRPIVPGVWVGLSKISYSRPHCKRKY